MTLKKVLTDPLKDQDVILILQRVARTDGLTVLEVHKERRPVRMRGR